MLRSRFLLFVTACAVFWACQSVRADPTTDKAPEQQKHVRILTVSNSFTQNATRYLNEITEAAGHKLTHKMLSIGGSPLELHAGMALAFEKDRSDNYAKYSRGESLQQALQSESWDFVTIQQLSIKSHNVETYRPYAKQLADIVHRYAPQAKLLVHQTWAYRKDDARFDGASTSADEPATQQAMYHGLSEAYRTITAELSARRIPVGDAFWIADNDPNFGYRVAADFDARQAKYPELPDQTHSLHVGIRWLERNGKQELRMDGHHANLAGEYLGACVWFECLFGESPVGNGFVPDKLVPEYAAYLQTVAHQAAQQGGDVVPDVVHEAEIVFDDPMSQRYTFQVRASDIDSRTKEYPEIGFVFGSNKKPADLEFASVN